MKYDIWPLLLLFHNKDAATQPRSEMVSQKTKLREPSMLVQRGPLPAVQKYAHFFSPHEGPVIGFFALLQKISSNI